jgi:hypothetical protein
MAARRRTTNDKRTRAHPALKSLSILMAASLYPRPAGKKSLLTNSSQQTNPNCHLFCVCVVFDMRPRRYTSIRKDNTHGFVWAGN